MAHYLWREEFAIGHPEIDQQHQRLFGLLDQLYTVVCTAEDAEGADDEGTVERIVTELVDYTRNHFFYEESLMRELGYLGLEQHRQEHQRLLGAVDEKMAALRRGDKIMRIDLLEFMNDWLSRHILQSDLQLARLLR
ncbi:MAG: bacteriohemerythrin [Motiliproteus sp.]